MFKEIDGNCDWQWFFMFLNESSVMCWRQKSFQPAAEVDRHYGVDYSHVIPVIPSGRRPKRRVKWSHSVTSAKSHRDYNMHRQGQFKHLMTHLYRLYSRLILAPTPTAEVLQFLDMFLTHTRYIINAICNLSLSRKWKRSINTIRIYESVTI